MANKMYDEVKATIKAELGEKYPTNKNGLSEEFIVKTFVPRLDRDDIIRIAAKRKELRSATKKDSKGEEVKVGNWFPAFRSWIGKEYFPEFNAKKAPKAKTDEMGKFLEDLLAEMGA